MGFGSILANTVGPLIEKDKMPLINFNFESSSAVDKLYMLRSMNHTLQYMTALAVYLKKYGQAEIPIVGSESLFLNAMIDSLKVALGKSVSLASMGSYNPTDLDFRSTITKLKSRNHKYVGLFLLPEQLIAFMKQAKELGFKSRCFGTDLFETSASIVPDSDLFEGCLYPDNEVISDFRKRYNLKFQNEAQLTFAGNAYDVTLLVGETLQMLNSFDSTKFIEALSNVHERKGVLGQFTYRKEKDFGQFFEFPVYVKSIKDSKGIPVKQ